MYKLFIIWSAWHGNPPENMYIHPQMQTNILFYSAAKHACARLPQSFIGKQTECVRWPTWALAFGVRDERPCACDSWVNIDGFMYGKWKLGHAGWLTLQYLCRKCSREFAGAVFMFVVAAHDTLHTNTHGQNKKRAHELACKICAREIKKCVRFGVRFVCERLFYMYNTLRGNTQTFHSTYFFLSVACQMIILYKWKTGSNRKDTW